MAWRRLREARTVFEDEEALFIPEAEHSIGEERFILLGLSSAFRVLVVMHGERDGGDVIRIVSARKADRGERADYASRRLKMKRHYDFSYAKKNPYAKRLKRSVTIRLDESTVEYFKALAEGTAPPYQSLINLYLRDCAASGRRLALTWRPSREGAA
jgi:uncharacterized DUF497 family protein